jgi:uncharacterized oligopeptide transporter (OPT) family protein
MSETNPIPAELVQPNHPPADDFELPIAGFTGTPEEIEQQWFDRVYRGRGDSMRQLSWRAVLMGSLLGSVLSLTNLYIGLKAGWSFGVAITACILSYTIWTTLYKIGLAKTPMSILENNCMQSTASAAGYSTGGTLISAFAAYMMLNGHGLSVPLMLGWVFFLAVLGVTMAIPMKRQMINIEQLRFPSGIAAAETLRALHSHGARAARSARALGIAGLVAAVNQFWKDGPQAIGKRWESFSLDSLIGTFNEKLFGKAWIGRTVMFDWDPIFLAAGALTGLRVSASMLIGGTLCWGVFVPILQQQGVHTGSGYREVAQWTLWGGVACMVTSSLLSFALQWRSVLRTFRSLGSLFGSGKGRPVSDVAAIEAPNSWFLAGQLFSWIGLAIMARMSFDMPYWQSTLAILFSFFLALVACRVTGETDTTPVGPMGKVMQLIFGSISPGNMNINLMSANIAAGSATSAADLLTDLKSGYLLGANPRQQFLAQFAGIFAGTVVTVLSFQALVPDPSVLGTEQFPAPAAQVWKLVAIAMSQGFAMLDPIKKWSILIGGLVGLALPLLAMAFPKQEKWIPSPSGVGLSWTFQWHYSLLFFLGALAGYALEKKSPKLADEYTFPVASGVIAGGSLMAVMIIFWENGPQILHQMMQQFAGK